MAGELAGLPGLEAEMTPDVGITLGGVPYSVSRRGDSLVFSCCCGFFNCSTAFTTAWNGLYWELVASISNRLVSLPVLHVPRAFEWLQANLEPSFSSGRAGFPSCRAGSELAGLEPDWWASSGAG